MISELNLEAFLQELETRKDYVNECLKKFLTEENAYPPVIHEAMHYAVFNGGKRLRPIMVLEGARIAHGNLESVVPTACAIELIHSYSLVHDDLPAMDNDDYRRGKLTCHKVFGEANAILTGDALLTAGFELMAKNLEMAGIEAVSLLKVIGEVAFAAGSQGMIGGQVLDLEAETKTIDYEALKVLHSLKTAELFRVSLTSGAILSGMNSTGIDALTTYARYFGLAFQITDDILDVQGNQVLTGKPAGSDARNFKTTYPSLFGIGKSWEMARENVDKCIESLAIFDEEADFLRNLAAFLLHRNS